jgi:YVTN family beta-propeller protein
MRLGIALVGAVVAASFAGGPAMAAIAGRSSAERRLSHVRTITGPLSPKSVVSSQTGLFFAQNMIYRHTIAVYDRRGRLRRTIPDAVRLARFGHRGYPGTVRGGPVETAFSPDGRYAYVSNYSMYGPGFSRPGDDVCSPGSRIDHSYVYRIDARRLAIDRVIRVGSVPKYVAATPDNRFVLVSNWCSYDLSVISVARGREVRRIPMGAYPRGIAVGPQGRYAYVAVMGSTEVARVDLRAFRVTRLRGIGTSPRHLVIDGEGRFMYVTLNAEGRTAKVDLRSGRVVAKVATGSAPRSMDVAPDGGSLYIVNNASNTLSKVRTRDMRVLQTVPTNASPIGVTYDRATHQVWVACYTGSIMVFRDT